MLEVAERQAEAERLEAEIAEVCGVLHATTGRLVELIRQVLETGAWEGAGIRSAEQWVAWKCALSPARARALVAMAKRLGELPETKAGLEAGEVSEDQAAVICRQAPADADAVVAIPARTAGVSDLRRALSSYPAQQPQERRRVSFGYTDEGSWSLSALVPADEGALWERALAAAREELFRAALADGEHKPLSWADAFVAVADRSLAEGAASRPHRDRHLVLLHVETQAGETAGHLHLGPGVAPGLRRFLSCDSRVRTVLESGGTPLSVGRALRTVPERTRVVVEDRDRGCRVPGCERSRWLHVHHIRHWEDGGASDTSNLVCLCSRHHRLHHLGRLGIEGDADRPGALVFTDERGRRLTSSSPPTPPRLRWARADEARAG